MTLIITKKKSEAPQDHNSSCAKSVLTSVFLHIFVCACIFMYSQTDTPFPLSVWALSAAIREKFKAKFKAKYVACCQGNKRGERGQWDALKKRDGRIDGGLAPTPNYTVTRDRVGNTSFGPPSPWLQALPCNWTVKKREKGISPNKLLGGEEGLMVG